MHPAFRMQKHYQGSHVCPGKSRDTPTLPGRGRALGRSGDAYRAGRCLMGYRLYREIMNGAPPEWGRPERLVALVIADDADEKTRRSWMPIEGCWRRGRWQDGICERTGLAPRSVRAALQRLDKRGYELRVPIGIGKDGRPVYAAKGQSTDFLVPPLPPRPPRPVPESGPFPAAFQDPKAAGNGPIGGRNLPQRRQESAGRRQEPAAPLLRSPQISPHLPAPSRRDKAITDIRQRVEVGEEEARRILEKIEERPGIKMIDRYVAEFPQEDLERYVAEIRQGLRGSAGPPSLAEMCGRCSKTGHPSEECPN